MILWSLTSSSLRFFYWSTSLCLRNPRVSLRNSSPCLYTSIAKNLGKKWTAGWCKRDKIIGLFCQWSIPQVDLLRWVAVCIITLLMMGHRVRYTRAAMEQSTLRATEGEVFDIGLKVSTKHLWPFMLSVSCFKILKKTVTFSGYLLHCSRTAQFIKIKLK